MLADVFMEKTEKYVIFIQLWEQYKHIVWTEQVHKLCCLAWMTVLVQFSGLSEQTGIPMSNNIKKHFKYQCCPLAWNIASDRPKLSHAIKNYTQFLVRKHKTKLVLNTRTPHFDFCIDFRAIKQIHIFLMILMFILSQLIKWEDFDKLIFNPSFTRQLQPAEACHRQLGRCVCMCVYESSKNVFTHSGINTDSLSLPHSAT